MCTWRDHNKIDFFLLQVLNHSKSFETLIKRISHCFCRQEANKKLCCSIGFHRASISPCTQRNACICIPAQFSNNHIIQKKMCPLQWRCIKTKSCNHFIRCKNVTHIYSYERHTQCNGKEIFCSPNLKILYDIGWNFSYFSMF